MKKKILFVSSSISFYEQFLYDLLQDLNKNFDCVILTNKKNITKNFDKFKIINLNIKRTYSLISDLINSILLIRYLIIIKPNLIISSSPKGGIITSVATSILPTKRIHLLTGIQWSDKTGYTKFFLKYIDKFIFYNSDKILVDSQSQIDYLSNNKFNISKFKLINKGSIKGVNTKVFNKNLNKKKDLLRKLNLNKNSIIIIFLGRFAEEKGATIFINLINEISKENKNIIGLMVGDDEKNIVKDYLSKNKIDKKKLIIQRYTNSPEIFLQVSDICCIPSSREGFCQVAIEASSCEIPTIGFDVVGLKDSIRNNVTGYLIKKNDINLFKEKLLTLINDKLIRKNFGSSGRKIVIDNFNTKEIIVFLRTQIEHFLSN